MRSLIYVVALGATACAPTAPHPAADPAAPVAPLVHRPLPDGNPPAPPLDWRAANDALARGGHAAHKH